MMNMEENPLSIFHIPNQSMEELTLMELYQDKEVFIITLYTFHLIQRMPKQYSRVLLLTVQWSREPREEHGSHTALQIQQVAIR